MPLGRPGEVEPGGLGLALHRGQDDEDERHHEDDEGDEERDEAEEVLAAGHRSTSRRLNQAVSGTTMTAISRNRMTLPAVDSP